MPLPEGGAVAGVRAGELKRTLLVLLPRLLPVKFRVAPRLRVRVAKVRVWPEVPAEVAMVEVPPELLAPRTTFPSVSVDAVPLLPRKDRVPPFRVMGAALTRSALLVPELSSCSVPP